MKRIPGLQADLEVWSKKENLEGNFIQKMEWRGIDPQRALIDRINKGIDAAESTISE